MGPKEIGPQVVADIEDRPLKCRTAKYQYIAVIIMNIMTFCHGNTIGWMSPASVTLNSQYITPLATGPISVSDEAFVGSIFSLGEIIGNVLFSVLSKYIGLKNCLLLLVIPDLTFWIIVSQATLPWHLAVARIFAGSTGGGIYVTNPLFVAEVADRRNRGVLGTYMMTFIMVGVACQYIVGSLVAYETVPYLFMWIQPCFLVLWFLLPNTPHQYIIKKKSKKAENAFIFYRLGNDRKSVDQAYISENIQNLSNVIENRRKNSTSLWNKLKVIYQWHILKPLLLGLALGAFLIFCGSFNVVTYTTMILDKSGAKLDPSLSGIAVGIFQIVGTYSSTLLVDRMGRRKLLMLSAACATFSSFMIGVFAFMYHHGVDMTSVEFLPVTFLCIFVVSMAIGLLPVPYVVFSELFTSDFRVLGVGINILAISVYGLVSNLIYPLMVDQFGLAITMWQSSAICVLAIVFVYFCLPETKGKELDTIDNEDDI